MLQGVPDRTRIGLENWLNATGAPDLFRDQLRSSPKLTEALLKLLGCSQAMCDVIVQNPEFPNVLFENPDPTKLSNRQELIEFGSQILTGSINYSHMLDRLRYFMQRVTFQIALIDVNGWQEPEKVWKGLSDLADAILLLTHGAAWENHRRMRFLGEVECPLHVVAFGKHGGQEVNYSSDLDLVFVLEDGLDEQMEREAIRFAESFIRALTDRMGRGALYRIDMRLRPYGASGELAKSMRATEQYYKLYAEAWESQALIRSRVVVGSDKIQERWEFMRDNTCFRGHISELTVFEIQQTRIRIDELADPQDFKRGKGGIRDVEFLVQMMQLIHGSTRPSMRKIGTISVLRELEKEGLLPSNQVEYLVARYTWLRQLEHRCQLVHNQQTHQLPDDMDEVRRIASSLDISDLPASLNEVRNGLAEIYTGFTSTRSAGVSDEDSIRMNRFLGSKIDDQTLKSIFRENRDSFARVNRLVTFAPLLETEFQKSWELGESLLSGEIEEEGIGSTLLTTWVRCWTRYTLGEERAFQSWNEEFAYWLSSELSGLEVLLLGSAGKGQMGPTSDCDLVLLCETKQEQRDLESWVSDWLKRTPKHPVEFDLRLRPEGGKGLLVRSLEGFVAYAHTDMEAWERYLLGFRRWVQEPREPFIDAMVEVDNVPWTEENDIELKAIKDRVERERLKDADRDIKLGPGGLMDLQWIGRVHQLRGTSAPELSEHEELMLRVRNHLQLLKMGDLLPLDPAGWEVLEEATRMKAIEHKIADLRHNVRKRFLDLYP